MTNYSFIENASSVESISAKMLKTLLYLVMFFYILQGKSFSLHSLEHLQLQTDFLSSQKKKAK